MRQRTRRGLTWAGAMVAWLAGLLAITPVVGTFPLIPIGAVVIRLTPGPIATAFIDLFGKAAQPLLVIGLAAGAVVAGVAAAALWRAVIADRIDAAISDRATALPARPLGVAVLTAIGTGLVAVSTELSVPLAAIGGATAIPPWLLLTAVDRAASGTDLARRAALGRTGLGLAALGALGGSSLAADRLGAGPADTPIGANESLDRDLERERKRTTGRTITGDRQPTAAGAETGSDDAFGFDFGRMPRRVGDIGEHYVVDINIDDPQVDGDEWELSVTGAVDTAYTLSQTALLDHPAAVSRPVTMACISNPVGGDLISTTTWQGVPIDDLLADAGVQERGVDLVTRAVDGYSEAIPLEVARERRVMLAFGAGGRTLDASHGYPARLLVPGRYGMKSTKWVTEIEVATEDHDAYWEARGWDEEAVVNTLSYIEGVDRRENRSAVGGVAFAGVRGIDRVEVSIDNGATWTDAELEPPAGPHTWRRWRHVFEAPITDTFDVVVRATDGTGAVQTDERSKPHPGGSTGWHHETI